MASALAIDTRGVEGAQQGVQAEAGPKLEPSWRELENTAVRQCRRCDHAGFRSTLGMLQAAALQACEPGRAADLETMGLPHLWERLLMAAVEGAFLTVASDSGACAVLDELRPLVLSLPFRPQSRRSDGTLKASCAARAADTGTDDSDFNDVYPHAAAVNLWVAQVCSSILPCDSRNLRYCHAQRK